MKSGSHKCFLPSRFKGDFVNFETLPMSVKSIVWCCIFYCCHSASSSVRDVTHKFSSSSSNNFLSQSREEGSWTKQKNDKSAFIFIFARWWGEKNFTASKRDGKKFTAKLLSTAIFFQWRHLILSRASTLAMSTNLTSFPVFYSNSNPPQNTEPILFPIATSCIFELPSLFRGLFYLCNWNNFCSIPRKGS